MGYELYFRELKVGIVQESDRDFPNLWGTIVYEPWVERPSTPEQLRLAKFLELDRRSMELVDVMDEQDVSQALDEVNEELREFEEYIETDDWCLFENAGKRLPLLVPILRMNGEIVWRWNPLDR